MLNRILISPITKANILYHKYFLQIKIRIEKKRLDRSSSMKLGGCFLKNKCSIYTTKMSTSYTLGYALSIKDVYFWCWSFFVITVALYGTFIKYPYKTLKLFIIALYFVRMHVLDAKTLHQKMSHRMLWHLHGELNIDEIKN